MRPTRSGKRKYRDVSSTVQADSTVLHDIDLKLEALHANSAGTSQDAMTLRRIRKKVARNGLLTHDEKAEMKRILSRQGFIRDTESLKKIDILLRCESLPTSLRNTLRSMQSTLKKNLLLSQVQRNIIVDAERRAREKSVRTSGRACRRAQIIRDLCHSIKKSSWYWNHDNEAPVDDVMSEFEYNTNLLKYQKVIREVEGFKYGPGALVLCTPSYPSHSISPFTGIIAASVKINTAVGPRVFVKMGVPCIDVMRDDAATVTVAIRDIKKM